MPSMPPPAAMRAKVSCATHCRASKYMHSRRISKRAACTSASWTESPPWITAVSSTSSRNTRTANRGCNAFVVNKIFHTPYFTKETQMASIEVNGKSYETDEEGYLINLGDWNEEIGKYLAQTESVEMTDAHWEVINFLRDYY